MDSKNFKPRKKSITASIQKAASKSLDKIEKLITGTNNKEIINNTIAEVVMNSGSKSLVRVPLFGFGLSLGYK